MRASREARSPLRAPSSMYLPSVETWSKPYGIADAFHAVAELAQLLEIRRGERDAQRVELLVRLRMNTGIRSSRSFATMTL